MTITLRAMNTIESRPLRYFVAVAQELNFTRAAERLGIAGPALSRAIAQLETRLGLQLLQRTTRRVTLTAAGTVLLEEASTALDALDAAARRAQRAEPAAHRLVLAVKPDLDGGLLEPVMAAYAREHAAVPLEVALCGWGEQAQLVRDGRADVALLPTTDEPGLDAETVLTERHVVALAAGSPLASRPGLCLSDLEDDFEPTDEPTIWGRRDGGELPTIDGLPQLLKLAELGRLAVLLPASVTERYARPQVAYRPVLDAPPAELAVAWPRSSHSLAVAAFVRVATDVAAAYAFQPARQSKYEAPS